MIDHQNYEYKTTLWTIYVAQTGIECRIAVIGVFCYDSKEDRQCKYNVILKRVHETAAAVEKQ